MLGPAVPTSATGSVKPKRSLAIYQRIGPPDAQRVQETLRGCS